MAETIAEVFIRLGTQGVADAARQITSVNTALDGLKQSAQLAFAAMNPSVTQEITSEQARLRQEFDAGSISIREYVEGLREVQNASRVLTATFDQRESMAKGLLSRFVGGDQQAEVAQLRRVITELQSAGNLSDSEAGQVSAGIDYEQQQRQMRALEQVSREMNQGIAASRQSAVDRAIAASDAEIDAELRKTRIAVQGAQEREQAERDAAAAATIEMARISSLVETDSQEKARLASEYVARAIAASEAEADAEIANTLRAFRVRQETQQGVLALRNEMVERAIAHSNAEIEAELRNTRVAMAAAANEQRFLEALEQSKIEMARGVSDARKNENEDRLRAAAITRQQETAQEGFNRKVEEYNRLRALGVGSGGISEETYARAVASANKELEHNNRLHALGKHGILGHQQALMQLSYALQDAAITADQGFGRAMQASANNISMVIPLMTESMALGMGLSVGFTALATAISMWERSSAKAREETDRLNKSLSDLPAVLNKIAEAQKNVLLMRDLLFEGSASSLESAARIKGREAALAREQAAAASNASAEAAVRATVEASGGMARGNINDPAVEQRLRDELIKRNVVGLTRAAAQAGVPDTENTRKQIQIDATRAAEAEIRVIKDKVAASEDVRKAVEEENRLGAEAVRLRNEQKEAQKAHVEAVSQEIYALEKEERAKRKAAEAAEKVEAAENRRGAVNRIERGLMNERQQSAFGAFEEFQRNIEAIAGAGNMTPEEKEAMAGKAGELFQNTLGKTEKDDSKRRFQPNFAGFADFGRQFQMSLFEDPAAKDRKEQIRLQKEANDEVRRLADALLGGIPGLPRFSPGGE